MKIMSTAMCNASRPGMNALVGSPFRIKQIQDGKESMRCPVCKTLMHPIFSLNRNINCGVCETLLYDGVKRIVLV
jgi:hypothetical protein